MTTLIVIGFALLAPEEFLLQLDLVVAEMVALAGIRNHLGLCRCFPACHTRPYLKSSLFC